MITLQAFGLRLLSRLLHSWTFTMRTGIARGFKRRYGPGFRPAKPISPEEDWLWKFDFAGMVVFDVGAYLGMYTLWFASRARQVVAFEPHPESYAELCYNIALNGQTNVTTLPLGLGRQAGQMELVIDAVYPSRSTLAPLRQSYLLGSRSHPTREVPVFPLDQLMTERRLPAPDFIKIDVEGFELEVLAGMRDTLARYHPRLFIELHGPLPPALVEMLRSADYQSLYHIEIGQTLTPATPAIRGGHLFCETVRSL